MSDIPIAIIVFNRPDMAHALVNRLREIRPSRLFVIADGARSDRPDEAEQVAKTRSAINHIDWPCDIARIYSDQNLGCGVRIRTGISQAFEAADKLIILEDDCRPNQTFFRFTDQLLNRYEDDRRVMAITGNCFHDRMPGGQSYYFSKYPNCWGWATWRRAWELYDSCECDWQTLSNSDRYAQLFETRHEQAYWTQLLDRIAQGRLDTWDVQWVLACWLNGGLTAAPTKNLVSNVGFNDLATHTTFDSPLAALPTYELETIEHPATVKRDAAVDRESDRLLYSGTWKHPGILKSTRDLIRRRYGNCRRLAPGSKAA